MISNALAQREVVGIDARASLAGVKRSSEPRTSVLRARVDDFDALFDGARPADLHDACVTREEGLDAREQPRRRRQLSVTLRDYVTLKRGGVVVVQ